jgi:cation transport protein
VLLSWLIFVLAGYRPLDALVEVTSATATVGLSTGITAQDLRVPLKLVLCLDMLLGRLEIVALSWPWNISARWRPMVRAGMIVSCRPSSMQMCSKSESSIFVTTRCPEGGPMGRGKPGDEPGIEPAGLAADQLGFGKALDPQRIDHRYTIAGVGQAWSSSCASGVLANTRVP